MVIRSGGLLTRNPPSSLAARAALGLAATASVVAAMVVSGGAAGADTASGVTGYQVVSGATTAITPGQSVAADAFCPNGKVVTSGGVRSHSPLTFIRTSYPLDSRSWQVVVTDTGTESYPESFTPYAVCVDASSVPGYHQVQTPSLPVGPNTYYGANKAVGDAYCNSGEVVIGGGVRSHNPSTLLTISRPTGDQRAWEVEVHLTNPPTWSGETYQVSAVCIPAADVSAYTINTATAATYGTALTPSAHSSAAGSPYCGSGLLAVAGGAINHDQDNGFISSVFPSNDSKYWLVADTDVNPPSYGDHFYPTAVCVTGSV